MTFQPFQNLYQYLTKKEPNLYQAFEKISLYFTDLYASKVTPITITLVKLTSGGNNGSLTIDATGKITAYKEPT